MSVPERLPAHGAPDPHYYGLLGKVAHLEDQIDLLGEDVAGAADLLSDATDQVAQLPAGVADLKDVMRQSLDELRAGMQTDFAEVHNELRNAAADIRKILEDRHKRQTY